MLLATAPKGTGGCPSCELADGSSSIMHEASAFSFCLWSEFLLERGNFLGRLAAIYRMHVLHTMGGTGY